MCHQLWSLSPESAMIWVVYVSLKRPYARKLVFSAATLGGDR